MTIISVVFVINSLLIILNQLITSFHCTYDNTNRVGDGDNECHSFVLEGVQNLTCVLSSKNV